jgi:hypothetical protein
MKNKPGSFTEWTETVNSTILDDPLWQFQVYPKALFLFELAWSDCDYLLQDERRAVSCALPLATCLLSTPSVYQIKKQVSYESGF